MTELTPLYMDINNAYSGDEFGLPWRDVMGEGIVGATDLAVTAGAGNSVNIAAGAAWVVGDTNTNLQPTYRGYNDGTVNKGITPDPSNPRYVLVVAQMTDAGFSGAQRNWTINVIHGTPAGVPTVPALPASALPLAQILVPTAAASSAAYTITDLRVRAVVGGGQALGLGTPAVFGPAWAATGTAVALGNGVSTGRFVVQGKMCFFQIFLQIGTAGVNIGTGSYRWTLPTPAQANWGGVIGKARMLDSSAAATYVGFVDMVDANTVQILTVASPATIFGAAIPVVPAANDTYFAHGEYEIA